jgi:hypothetical protein
MAARLVGGPLAQVIYIPSSSPLGFAGAPPLLLAGLSRAVAVAPAAALPLSQAA